MLKNLWNNCWCFRNPAVTSWGGKFIPIIYKVDYKQMEAPLKIDITWKRWFPKHESPFQGVHFTQHILLWDLLEKYTPQRPFPNHEKRQKNDRSTSTNKNCQAACTMVTCSNPAPQAIKDASMILKVCIASFSGPPVSRSRFSAAWENGSTQWARVA